MNAASDLHESERDVSIPVWRGWLNWASLAATGFTVLCCLGVSAAISLATSVGATFLTEDRALRPILAGTLALTIAASGLTYWRHRHAGPLILTAFAAVWVYSVIFIMGGSHRAHTEPGTAEHMAEHTSGGFGTGRQLLAWIGLSLLVAAQVWDVVRIRGRRRPHRSRQR